MKYEYDLIVLDVNLPDGNGFELCNKVKERCPDTAVIFLTARDMESDQLRGFELGADDYVTKPFPMSVFQKKVAALLNRISKQDGGDCYDDGNLFINFSEMTAAKLSFNKVCVITGLLFVLISISMITALYFLTGNMNVVWCGLLYAFLVFFCMVFLVALIRRNLLLFSDTLCRTLDNMMAGEITPPQIRQEESIFYKINHRLTRLYEVMRENRRSIAKERADLQELISDISHQVKTPIANLKMVNATLLEQPMPQEKQREFLTACGGFGRYFTKRGTKEYFSYSWL